MDQIIKIFVTLPLTILGKALQVFFAAIFQFVKQQHEKPKYPERPKDKDFNRDNKDVIYNPIEYRDPNRKK